MFILYPLEHLHRIHGTGEGHLLIIPTFNSYLGQFFRSDGGKLFLSPSSSLSSRKDWLAATEGDKDLFTSTGRTQPAIAPTISCPCLTLAQPLHFAFSPPSRSTWPSHLGCSMLSCEQKQGVTGLVSSNHCYELTARTVIPGRPSYLSRAMTTAWKGLSASSSTPS